MNAERHLVIFARAPRVGEVKTRLAADIGEVAAWRFYRDTSAAIVRRLSRDPRWTCRLAVTPDRFASEGRFWPRHVRRVPQGGGDLGARMARQIRRLSPGPVVIVGTDSPELRAAHVERAFRALEHSDAVLGPAPDGGFWLIGVRRRRGVGDIFRNVRFSTRHALADTLKGLGPQSDVHFLEHLADIDDGEDLRRFYERRQAMSSHTESPANTTPTGAETHTGT